MLYRIDSRCPYEDYGQGVLDPKALINKTVNKVKNHKNKYHF